MAGIGFELRKVISQGRLSNAFNAAVSGILIVAGPWLLTMLTIFFIRLSFESIHMVRQGLFQAAVIYSYAFSLSLFSAVHFLFTRITADLLWEKKEREAAAWLVYFCVGVVVLASLIAGVPAWLVDVDGVRSPGLFRFSLVVLFVAVNLLWVVMLFISLLKHYVKIMVVYLIGMGASVGLVAWWGSLGGAGAAVLGFAAGHLLIVAALLWLSLKEFPPLWPSRESRRKIGRYARKYALLVLSGLFFYLGQWLDKIVFWFTRGAGVDGSSFKLFDSYDFPVYLAGLTVIPGLVYFVIFSETAFYFSLVKFLNCLAGEPYAVILQARFNLVRTMNHELRDQSLFQACMTGVALLAVLWLFPGPQASLIVLAMVGAFFQLLLLTLLNFLYYFEQFPMAFAGAGVFLAFQLIFAGVGVAWPGFPPGVGYLVSTATAAAVTFALLQHATKSLDRRIFLKAVG
jgi:uncharacterized membrane protein